MNNPNAGKKALIPIGTAHRHSAAAVADKAKAIMSHVVDTTKTTDFRPSAKSKAAPAGATRGANHNRRRRAADDRKTKMKGIYFEEPVYEALVHMQDEGQNASKWVNRLVKEKLGL